MTNRNRHRLSIYCQPVITKRQESQSKPGMARAQTNGGRDDNQQGGRQSCRMEAMQPEVWLTCSGRRPCCQWRVRSTPSTPAWVCPRQEPMASTSPSDITDSVIPQRTDSHQAGGNGPIIMRAGDRQEAPHGRSQRPLGDAQENSPPGGAPQLEDEVSERVAHRLRIIGDDINATFLQRGNAVLPWQNWRGVCRGLFLFITNTLCTVYQRRRT
ncbi:bcl-2-binding component 3 [Brienomyrus brachyistius]|uniref:bcl-2-binding component 3 n=1 Tax=Brienomyrus brachyistius TaxID=42636 RepID=UPI0020B36EFC|nr:bcl-2-binding component 3 [Brienomyrus brachyistius]